MLAVSGYYENGVCVPSETLVLKERQRVIITVLDENELSNVPSEKQRRNDILKSLSGILPSTITDDEVKMCRSAK